MRDRPVIRKKNFPYLDEYVGGITDLHVDDYDVLPGTEIGTIMVVFMNKYITLPVKIEDYDIWLRKRKIEKIYGRIKTTEVPKG